MLRGACMPASRTKMCRSRSFDRMPSSAAAVTFGSMPRKASLAPSSTITASVPCGTDQSRRPSPPEAVSPDTPALATLTAMPLAFSACANLAGKAPSAGSPKPALSESPSTTIFTGRSSAARAPPASVKTAAASANAAKHWTRTGFAPYVRGRERRNHMKAPSEARPTIAQPAIRLADVNLSLGQGAARVHILKDIGLNIGSGEAIGLVGPSGSGKSTLLMVMAGLERADTGTVTVAGETLNALDEDALARFRGRHVGIVFQSFHLIPTMTALENVAVPLELAGVADALERAEA